MANNPTFLIGEAWGANEARLGYGFVGAAGVELLRMLDESGVLTLSAEDHALVSRYWQTSESQCLDAVWRMHPEVHRTNVFNLHPLANDIASLCGPKAEGLPGYGALVKGKFVRAEFAPEIKRLAAEILERDPNLIICLGNTPLWAMAGTTGIAKLRGTTLWSTHCVTDYKLLPTYHPAAVLRQWELRPTVVADLIKAAHEQTFPEIRRPRREIWIEPTLDDLEEFYAQHIRGCRILSVDIETAGSQVTCLGLAPTASAALVIPFFDARKKGRSYWPTKEDECRAWSFARRVLEAPQPGKVFQNGLYDIAFLWRSVGVRVRGAIEDTMLLHHSLQPESLKSLGFLGSIYANESAWKSERRGTRTIKRDE